VLARNGQVSYPQMPYSMFVKGVQGKKLLNPVIKRRNSKGQIDLVAHAREGDLRVDKVNKLLLIRMRHCLVRSDEGDSVYSEDKKLDIPLEKFDNSNRRARDMTWVELVGKRQELAEEMEEIAEEIAAKSAELALGGYPADLPKHVQNLREKHRDLTHQDRLVYVEMLMRPALSLGCLCFIFVGCPIGIMFSRGDYLGAFITCFLPIVIVYYPLYLAGTNMAKEGRLNEVLLTFAADIVVILGGLVLFRWLMKN
jgi:lipopolysaccharide export system permease protein